MADCDSDKYIELINAALDGACSPAETAELEAHLAVCPACKALYEDLKTIHDAMAALPTGSPPADLKDRIMAAVEADNVVPLPAKKAAKPWKRWGATAAAALIVALGAWGLGQSGVGREANLFSAPRAAMDAPDEGDALDVSLTGAPIPCPEPSLAIGSYSMETTNGQDVLPSGSLPQSVEAAKAQAPSDPPSGPASGTPALTAGEALDLLLETEGFEGYTPAGEAQVSWPREGDTQDNLVYDTLSSNGLYHVFVLYRNVYDSPEDLAPSHNSRCLAYAVALDGSEVLEESGPEFWDRLSK